MAGSHLESEMKVVSDNGDAVPQYDPNAAYDQTSVCPSICLAR